jgi:hypothetical protein
MELFLLGARVIKIKARQHSHVTTGQGMMGDVQQREKNPVLNVVMSENGIKK